MNNPSTDPWLRTTEFFKKRSFSSLLITLKSQSTNQRTRPMMFYLISCKVQIRKQDRVGLHLSKRSSEKRLSKMISFLVVRILDIYRVCHGFILTKRDDNFWVNFDHFWSKHHYLRQLLAGAVVEIGLKPKHYKF